jgi:hypothetical protein
MSTRKFLILSGVAATIAAAGLGVAVAQQRPDGMGPGRMGQGGGGMMEGGMHGMMGGGRMGGMAQRFCTTKASFAPFVIERIEKTVQPTDAQKPDFEALKTAITKAEADLKAACPSEAELADRTPPGRLNLAEKHMSAGLAAIGTIKGPFNALYAKLDDAQRDRIRWSERRMGERGGHHRDHHAGSGGWWRWH